MIHTFSISDIHNDITEKSSTSSTVIKSSRDMEIISYHFYCNLIHILKINPISIESKRI